MSLNHLDHPDRSDERKWRNLLIWLQEHGMDIDKENLLVEPCIFPGSGRGLAAIQDIPPNSKLFTIPKQCLLNADTLCDWVRNYRNGPENTQSPQIPQVKAQSRARIRSLNAVQVLTLYLTIHNPNQTIKNDGNYKNKSVETEDSFLPYLEILPVDFDFHPLTWAVETTATTTSTSKQASQFRRLLALLPPQVRRKLENLQSRFKNDVVKVQAVEPGLSEIECLWGWLIVNTRSLYYKCTKAKCHEDNVTLCPILDLANHSLSAPNFNTEEHRRKGHPVPTMVSPGPRPAPSSDLVGLRKGEEVFLLYGHHSNQDLFVEYGFVDMTTNGSSDANTNDAVVPKDICIDNAAIALFENTDQNLHSRDKKALLQSKGYWGDWTLHTNPPPAHPSYRLVPVLRLLVLDWNTDNIRKWEATVSGYLNEVSSENTRMAKAALYSICKQLHSESLVGLSSVTFPPSTPVSSYSSSEERKECQVNMIPVIRSLWEEQRDVSLAVMQSIDSGLEL